MRLQRLAWQLWPWRWVRALGVLLRGARMHPSVVLMGQAARCTIGRGSVLGAGVRVDLGARGRLILGERVWLAAGTEIETASAVSIGAGTTIQRRGSINGNVRIGRGCIFAPNVFVSSGAHPFRHVPYLPIREQERLLSEPREARALLDRPVWIQDDCWLGANVVVSAGVTIGRGSVIGANAVVTHNVSPYAVMGGVPAHKIGHRLLWSPPDRVVMNNSLDRVYVLAGAMPQPGGGVAVRVGDPLVVAIRSSTGRVRVRFRANAAIDIYAGDTIQHLQRGDDCIELPAQELMQVDGHQILGVNLSVHTTHDSFEVYEVTRA